MRLVLLALLLLSAGAGAYTEISTLVHVDVGPDATAHVSERYSLFLQTDSEVEEFENLRKFGSNTVIGWKRFLPSIKYHVSGPVAPASTRVTARRLFDIGARSASIEIEYDVDAPLFNVTQVKGRTRLYELDSSSLSFDRTERGAVALSPITTLEFALPKDAAINYASLSPAPSSVSQNAIQWVGPLTSEWSLSYSIEASLSDEVSDYFTGIYENLTSLIPTLLPIALVLLLAAFAYNKFRPGRH